MNSLAFFTESLAEWYIPIIDTTGYPVKIQV